MQLQPDNSTAVGTFYDFTISQILPSTSMLLTSFSSKMGGVSNFVSKHETPVEKDTYIYGLRGILAISSFLWIYFETFIPAVASFNEHGPLYQRIIRVVFSTIFWNESLISSFFYVLSARAICVRFLKDPKADNFAGAIIRRSIRIVFAIGAASFIAYGIFGGIGTKYISTFKQALPNHVINAPHVPKTALQGFNAVFDMFWIVRQYNAQAGNAFWPTGTLGQVSLLYTQSWTVYYLMVLLPYGRPAWHVQVLGVFMLGAFWMCSWGWYSSCALLLADATINSTLSSKLVAGLTINTKKNWTVPYSLIGAIMLSMGLAMKYTWAALPQYINKELVLHPFLDLSENTTADEFGASDPYPRVDNFFVIFGLLLIIETTSRAKTFLSSPWLVSLGKRSLSIFVAQSLVVWTAGIKLWLHLHLTRDTHIAVANLAVFVTSAAAVAVFSEVFYRAIDAPSQWLATLGYSWVTK